MKSPAGGPSEARRPPPGAKKTLFPFLPPPSPAPASVCGLTRFSVALWTGILKPEQVRETAAFLIEIMPVMFIPAAAGLLDAWPSLRPIWLPVTLITVITTVVVMAVTGQVTQYMIRREKRTNDASRSKTQTWQS